jgi:hypothetical protein
VVARGMFYAVSADDEAEMLHRAGNQTSLVEYLDTLFDDETEEWQFDIDKAWDEMHRTLGDGDLTHELAHPLAGVVLGGRKLSAADWFIIVHKGADQVSEIADAAEAHSDDDFRERYIARSDLFDWHLLGWRDALCKYKQLKWFYRRAANAKRAVIFAVDQ